MKVWVWVRRGRDGDAVAEGGELGEVAAKLAFGVDVAGVVVGAEVVEPGVCVDQQMPDHDEDGAGDGDEGFELASTFDYSPVAFAEEGVCLGGCGGGLAEHSLEVGVALAGSAAALDRPGLDGARAQFRPRHQVRGRGEYCHVRPDLGENDLRGGTPDAGNFVEPLDRGEP